MLNLRRYQQFTLASVCCWLLLATSTTFAAPFTTAHPVSVVQADIYVDQHRTTMKLTCFAEDLELLQGVEALEDGRYDSEELKDATKDHAQYLAERIKILDSNGEPLTPKITQIIDFEIPDEGIKAGTLMSYVMAFVLEYEYEQPPNFFTFEQEMVADGALLPSELKILLKQAGSETPYTHMLKPGRPETFRFDWDQPALAPDAPAEDWENWFEQQREKTLGIDSYSSTYSFVYIDDYEVRHEVLVPLATLAALIEFERAEPRFLTVAEQETARQQIETWFSSGNPVTIDGAIVEPKFDRIDFYGLDLSDFAMRSKARKVSMASGRVGVIMSYPTAQPPDATTVTWDMFNHAIRSVDSVIFAYDETLTTAFSTFLADNTFTWKATTKRELPTIEPVAAEIDIRFRQPAKWTTSLLSIVLSGVVAIIWLGKLAGGYSFVRTTVVSLIALITAVIAHAYPAERLSVAIPIPFTQPPEFTIAPEPGTEVFAKLHQNLFRAFEFRTPSDIYDALAKTVDGPLLRELYLDIHRSLKIKEQGGAVAKIQAIEILESQPAESVALLRPATNAESTDQPFQFGWRSKWNLSGSVEHWSHIHQRINQYDATFAITEREGLWKITGLQMTDNQGTVKTDLRTGNKRDEDSD